MSTRESWAHMRNRGYHIAQNEPMVTDSTCDSAPCRSICGQCSECNCSLESISCGHLEDEGPEAARSAKGEKSTIRTGDDESLQIRFANDIYRRSLTRKKAVIGRHGPARRLVVNATIRGPVKAMKWNHLMRPANRRMMIHPVSMGPVDAKGDMGGLFWE